MLDAIIATLLVISAYILSKLLTKSTGKKQNTCLLRWHIVNLFLLTSILIANAVLFMMHKYNPKEESIEYYYALTVPISDFVDIYVNLFLLWLLYKFMKPQKMLASGRTVASTVVFAHDHIRAESSLLDSMIDNERERKEQIKQD